MEDYKYVGVCVTINALGIPTKGEDDLWLGN